MNSNQARALTRSIEENDYEPWRQLWLDYQVFYEVSLPAQVASTTFQRFLDPDEPVFSYVATQDGQLIGFVNAVVHRSTWSTSDFCYLEDLYVSPAVRSAGAGKLLIESVQALARQRRCARLYWHTHETNKRAQKLYDWVAQRSGFIEYRMPL